MLNVGPPPSAQDLPDVAKEIEEHRWSEWDGGRRGEARRSGDTNKPLANHGHIGFAARHMLDMTGVDYKPFQNPMEPIELVSQTKVIRDAGRSAIAKPFVFSNGFAALVL